MRSRVVAEQEDSGVCGYEERWQKYVERLSDDELKESRPFGVRGVSLFIVLHVDVCPGNSMKFLHIFPGRDAVAG